MGARALVALGPPVIPSHHGTVTGTTHPPQHKIAHLFFLLLLGGKKKKCTVTRIIFQTEVRYELKSVKKEEERHFTNH